MWKTRLPNVLMLTTVREGVCAGSVTCSANSMEFPICLTKCIVTESVLKAQMTRPNATTAGLLFLIECGIWRLPHSTVANRQDERCSMPPVFQPREQGQAGRI